MRKFILLTKSDSGDNYHYFIESEREPTEDKLDNFLIENCNDKLGNEIYEYVDEIFEVNDENFIKI